MVSVYQNRSSEFKQWHYDTQNEQFVYKGTMANNSQQKYVLGFGKLNGPDSDKHYALIRQISEYTDYKRHFNWGNRIEANGASRSSNLGSTVLCSAFLYAIICCLACIPTWEYLTQCGGIYQSFKEGKTVDEAAIQSCGGYDAICNDLSSNPKCTPLSEANRHNLSSNVDNWFDLVETKLKIRIESS